jgi:hypothetical protein
VISVGLLRWSDAHSAGAASHRKEDDEWLY